MGVYTSVGGFMIRYRVREQTHPNLLFYRFMPTIINMQYLEVSEMFTDDYFKLLAVL
tara:strand:- start:292 stop:462 length:171 start_codon:yes stop_codon:yes gene_type:complete